MHELSLCRSIAEIAERHAEGRTVERVRVTVGQFRQVVPATLVHCWTLVSEGTPLAGSVLEITEVAASVTCRGCGETGELDSSPALRCPACGSTEVALVTGDELLISSLDLTEAV